MNKEQYNSFDDWFREAALQPGPPVHEAAWQAMEAKLDGQKKRRRAIFWWWLGSLFLTGGIFMLTRLNNPSTENRTRATVDMPTNTQRVIPDITAGAETSIASGHKPGVLNEEQDTRYGAVPPAGQQKVNGKSRANKVANAQDPENESGEVATNKPVGVAKETATVPALADKKKYENATRNNGGRKQKSTIHKTNSKAIDPGNPKAAGETTAAASLTHTDVKQDAPSMTDEVKTHASENQASDSAGLQNEKPVPLAVTPTDSTSNKKASRSPVKPSHFYVFGAAAPEWSYVKSRGAGDVSLSYGLGIGYSFSKKWAIQAGVFLAGKKYTAGNGDYTPKPGSYYDNPNIVIESVDADCDVLEIPLSVRYTFLQKNKMHFFALLGMASTVMKKEEYAYDFLRYGNPAYYQYTYKTGAFNLFSTASLSVGMESRLNKHFSLLVAPYFNIPIQGIGEGKVYINSFGVQGGLKYNLPF